MYIITVFTDALSAIMDLPWTVKGPGFVLIAFFLFRSFTQFLTLHPIRAVTSIVYAFIVALVLSRFGVDITNWLITQQVIS